MVSMPFRPTRLNNKGIGMFLVHLIIWKFDPSETWSSSIQYECKQWKHCIIAQISNLSKNPFEAYGSAIFLFLLFIFTCLHICRIQFVHLHMYSCNHSHPTNDHLNGNTGSYTHNLHLNNKVFISCNMHLVLTCSSKRNHLYR